MQCCLLLFSSTGYLVHKFGEFDCGLLVNPVAKLLVKNEELIKKKA
jgi:hypothetical protein